MASYIKGKEFKPAPQGTFAAVCVDVVDEGWKTTEYGHSPKIRVTWELEALMEDGKRFIISKYYKPSLHTKSNLHKDLRSWRGKPFTADELKKFDIDTVIGAPCQIVLVHEEVEGVTYANIALLLKAEPAKKLIASGKYVRVKDRPDYQPPEKSAFAADEPEEIEATAPTDADIPF